MTMIRDQIDLLRLRVSKDPEAFGRIYDRYVEAIYRFVAFKLPTPEDAQDVTGEVFLKAWEHLQGGLQVLHLRAFLYQVARNSVADRYRRRGPAGEALADGPVTFSQLAASSITGTFDQGDAGRSTSRTQAQAEVALLLRKLERLKDQYRDILLLRLVDDLPFDAISSVLNVSSTNARVLYHRALKALKQLNDSTS